MMCMYLLIYVKVTLSVRIYFLRLGKSVSERADDGIMIMPHTPQIAPTIGTAPRPRLLVSAQTLSSPGLLLVKCVV